ncbi:MAG: M23 family metallopeptidase [Acidobacteria bacterium]|nr:M23 family metallopeptidase [Acidobacteriota bacterium]
MALAAIGGFSLFGFVSSYVRMAIKVADYNNLRDEINVLRERYQRLESESKTAGQQLASLQLLANEVSLAYGIKQKLEGPAEIAREGRLVPTMRESLDQYNFLKGANFSRYARKASQLFQTKMMPAIWPVDGRLLSHFGKRLDPFSGEGAFHTGVDISAGRGTLIKATADGIVMHAEWGGDYGRLVVIDHGGGVQTYYAHMSRIDVVAGQGIRRGEIIGLSGATGRVTSPHLHYEVRRGGTPINPYPYLRSTLAQARPSTDLGF